MIEVNKKKVFNDPVYGFISIPSARIFDLIEHPYFQRLRRIKQVGLTHYVYPGALHTRFQHALGAMHLMHEAIEVLRSKGTKITGEEAEGAMIAILLHDIGHGPYSHALEGVLIRSDHEVLTSLFMQQMNTEFDGALTMAIDIFEGRHSKQFLHQLVSSQLDVDRLDYLKRDSFFTGVAEGNIGHDRIIKMLDVADGQIVVEQKAVFSIEKFLMARRLMYWQVYLHKTVIAAEHMLRRLLVLARVLLQSGGTIEGLPALLHSVLIQHPNPENYADPVTLLEEFAALDDVDIVYGLKVMAKCDQPIIRMLASDILGRKLFHTELHSEAIDDSHLAAIVDKVASEFGLSVDLASQLVIHGLESIPTYRTGVDEIQMLQKNGQVVALSDILNIRSDTVSEAYYVCYPKQVRG